MGYPVLVLLLLQEESDIQQVRLGFPPEQSQCFEMPVECVKLILMLASLNKTLIFPNVLYQEEKKSRLNAIVLSFPPSYPIA